jgi:hypothetical protein
MYSQQYFFYGILIEIISLILYKFFIVGFFNSKNKGSRKDFLYHSLLSYGYQPTTLRSTPAATAEPITPATFGPIACMRRKLPGFSA